MTNRFWLGDGSANLAAVAGNWTPSGIPGAGDVAIFDDKANDRNCNFNIATSSSALTVGEIIVESNFGGQVILNTKPVTKGVYLGKAEGIKTGSIAVIDFRQGGGGSEYGAYKSFANRFLMITNVGSWSGSLTLNMYGGSSQVTKFDDGDHQTVALQVGKFAPNYVAPTNTSGKTTFTAFSVVNGVVFQPTGNLVDNDRLKHLNFNAFTCASDLFNAGAATCEFRGSSGGFMLPITGSAGYGQTSTIVPSGFVSYIRKVILNVATAGHKVLIADNNYVSLEELEIGDGVMLLGPTALTAQGADIRLVNAPKIRGSWSFSQISQGVYRSPRHASGPMPKITGNFNITGKLDVGGLIDPTGLELTPIASNPGGTAANTIWIDSDDSLLYFGSNAVAVGAAGDITGVTITTDSGGGSKATDTAGSADFSILGTAGVGVTNSGATITVTAVPGEIDHDSLQNFAANEHVNWAGASAGTIHASNYTDTTTNTQLSNAQVRTAVEAATDSNVFADADHTKLNGIEASADVTDATNVGAAGALMDSEVTNLAEVKAFDASDYATAAQGAKADSALQPIFGRWGDIASDHTENKATNILVDNWNTFTGSSALNTAMSSGVFTCTSALAGTYLITSHLLYKTGTLAEVDGRDFQIQNNLLYASGGGDPAGGALYGFTRHINADKYSDTVIEGNYLLTLANGDTFGIYGKIGCGTSGTVKVSAINTFTNLHMVKIA